MASLPDGTTTTIAISLSVAAFVGIVGCIVYIRCFSKLEEEQEAWGRKSIDLDGAPPQLPMYEVPKDSGRLLLAHDEEDELPLQAPVLKRKPVPHAERYSYHTHNTSDREEGESKFTETTVGRFYENLDKAQKSPKKPVEPEEESDDDIEV